VRSSRSATNLVPGLGKCPQHRGPCSTAAVAKLEAHRECRRGAEHERNPLVRLNYSKGHVHNPTDNHKSIDTMYNKTNIVTKSNQFKF